MNPVVIDASAALSWALASQRTSAASALYARHSEFIFVAPAIFAFEFRNALLAAARSRRISPADVDAQISLIGERAIVLEPFPDNLGLAQIVGAARANGLSLYDAAYVDLASNLTAALASRDGALLAAATRLGLQVLDVR